MRGNDTQPRSQSRSLFDLENPQDQAPIENTQLVLEQQTGLVVIDEIQLHPDIFSLLRVLSDRQKKTTRLILGSASRDLLRQGNKTLAGRILFPYLNGSSLDEIIPPTGINCGGQAVFREPISLWMTHYRKNGSKITSDFFAKRISPNLGFKYP